MSLVFLQDFINAGIINSHRKHETKKSILFVQLKKNWQLFRLAFHEHIYFFLRSNDKEWLQRSRSVFSYNSHRNENIVKRLKSFTEEQNLLWPKWGYSMMMMALATQANPFLISMQWIWCACDALAHRLNLAAACFWQSSFRIISLWRWDKRQCN